MGDSQYLVANFNLKIFQNNSHGDGAQKTATNEQITWEKKPENSNIEAWG